MATKITEASLTCSICLRRFRKPRALPCLHSYCEECLIEYAPSGTQVLMCPLCQEKVSVPDGDVSKLKLDFRLQSQVEEANRYEQEACIEGSKVICTCCEDEAAALAKCEECDQMLCTSGMKAHKNLSTLRKHTLMYVKDKSISAEQTSRTRPQKGHPIEERAILVSKLPCLQLSPQRMRDRLTIHFQRKRNGGGDVEGVIYPLKGCPQSAIVVFNDKRTCETAIKSKQFLEEFQKKLTIQLLPLVFKRLEAEIDSFYWNLIPRLTSPQLIDDLSKRFGKTNLQTTAHVLKKVTCTPNQVEEMKSAIVNCIVKEVGLPTSVTDESGFETGIFIKNIPFLTNDTQQLREELIKHLEMEVSQIKTLISPLQGNAREAIALFQSDKGRTTLISETDLDEYVHNSDKGFYGGRLIVSRLPHVFKLVKVNLDIFFAKLTRNFDIDLLRSKLLSSCNEDVIIGDNYLTCSAEQLMEAKNVILEMIGLSKQSLLQIAVIGEDKNEEIHTQKPLITQSDIRYRARKSRTKLESLISDRSQKLQQTAESVGSSYRSDSDHIEHNSTSNSTDWKKVPTKSKENVFHTEEGMKVMVEKNDIEKQNVDVIVNAANTGLTHYSGVAGALKQAAGYELQTESDNVIRNLRHPLIETDCVHTKGYRLSCKFVVHAIGPTYAVKSQETMFYTQLEKTFLNCFTLAGDLRAKSIALPLISSGTFGGPKDVCAKALTSAIRQYSRQRKNNSIDTMILVNRDDDATDAILTELNWL